MKTTTAARCFVITLICFASITQPSAVMTAPVVQAIPVPDRFSHAEPFIRTLEAGGLVVQDIKQSHQEAAFGGGQRAAYIVTDHGVVEVVVLPGATDAEQLTVMYTKWNGNKHHFYITGPSVPRAEDMYGQFAYITLYKNWFIMTYEPALDGIIKRILGQVPAR